MRRDAIALPRKAAHAPGCSAARPDHGRPGSLELFGGREQSRAAGKGSHCVQQPQKNDWEWGEIERGEVEKAARCCFAAAAVSKWMSWRSKTAAGFVIRAVNV